MVGARSGVNLGRREFAVGCALLPLATCTPMRPDKDVAFVAQPPKGQAIAADDPRHLVELIKRDSSIILDMRYATAHNFTGHILYDEPRAFLVSAAAQSLIRAHKRAQADGYGLTIFDAYRPWRVTKKLWDATPIGPKKNYVANPKRGSRHNRGCAVDLTLHDLRTGMEVEMPSGFDDFSTKAHRDYSDDTPTAAANARRLESYMFAEGFIGMSNEWWHFDYAKWQDYPVMDIPFSQI